MSKKINRSGSVDLQTTPDQQFLDHTTIQPAADQSAEDRSAARESWQRAADLSPDDPQMQEQLQSALLDHLKDDAYLAFLAETEKHDVVSFRQSRPIMIPKARAPMDAPAERQPTEGERALGMLRWVIIGLIPAGIGALILSPLAIGRAAGVLSHRAASTRDRRLAWLTIGLALVCGALGMVFALAFVLHVIA